ncbi:Pre-rRNA-processing protein las1 [Galdieria sulphuraria]|nr:Pre-rRNA-processing protein las1 [Galdieria sulphuraria]
MAIPVAVDSGAQLVELCWKQDSITEPIFSLALACAIVRLVNGMVDNMQESSYAVSVTGLASQLGLPVFVAEMRHDISHNALPSREALLFATKECLQWLKKHYFFAQWEQLVPINHNILSYLQLYEDSSKQDGCSKERKRSLAIQITKNISGSSVGSLLFPALVNDYLIPEDYQWNASVEAIWKRWNDALLVFQQRWPFFVTRLYWYLFVRGWKLLATNQTKRISLIFGWLRCIVVEMRQWLFEMELKWLNQLIEFSIHIYLKKMNEFSIGLDTTTTASVSSWLETCKMVSTCKSSWGLLLYCMEKEEMVLHDTTSCDENHFQPFQVTNEQTISNWTKCEQPFDCPIGSIVDWRKANFLYKQAERKKETESECPSGKTHFLSDDLLDRISQF